MTKVETFKICTFNCNGLGNSTKRRDVFDYLRELNANIYFLQETHWKTEMEKYIRSAWGYDVLVCGKETNKNGVAILFNNNFEYVLHDVIRDPNGCYIVADIEFLKKRFTVVNNYGPSAGDDPGFVNVLQDRIDQFNNNLKILGGDWNCCMNMRLDARDYATIDHRPRTREKLKDFMAKNELFDVARELYPEKRMYSWRKFTSHKQARLDYFLVSKELLTDTNSVETKTSHCSDHSCVLLNLNREQFKRDRPFWKFNGGLLSDRKYVQEIKKVIHDTKIQYTLPVYNLDEIDGIPNKDIQFTINDQTFFEVLLMEIRGKSIAYSCHKKKTDNEKLNY
jgi:exonuclease III